MEKVLQCDCGFEARAEDEGELVAQVQQHAWEAHGMALSPDEALLLAVRGELSETLPPRTPVREAAGGPSEDDSSERREEQ